MQKVEKPTGMTVQKEPVMVSVGTKLSKKRAPKPARMKPWKSELASLLFSFWWKESFWENSLIRYCAFGTGARATAHSDCCLSRRGSSADLRTFSTKLFLDRR